ALDAQKALATRLEMEQARYRQQEAALDAQLKTALEARAAMETQLAFSQKQAADEQARIQNEMQNAREMLVQAQSRWEEESKTEREQWEKQTKEFVNQLAQVRLQEAAAREEFENQTKTWTAEREQAQRATEQREQEIKRLHDALTQWTAKEADYRSQRDSAQQAASDLASARTLIKELHNRQSALEKELQTLAEAGRQAKVDASAKEKESEESRNQMRDAFNKMRSEMVEMQAERTRREDELNRKEAGWKKKEEEWTKTRDEWEKTRLALEEKLQKAVSTPPPAPAAVPTLSIVGGPTTVTAPVPEEAVRALTAIRQQMQEMQTLLNWLRPAKKPLNKAA
ncbi:MAG TPA: hypothetical protein VMU17_01210, partial [Elusimicrobiota bacterium]|nr:hypothetical protein [Elusimicrobiota bacterium]